MSTAKRVIKNTSFLYAKMGITMFISLYTTRLVLNALGASDFGIFNIVGGAIAMLGFLNGSMAAATQRFMSFAEGEGNKEKQKKIFNVSAVLHFFIALLLGLALLIAGCFFFTGLLNIEADRMYAAKVVYGSLIISTMFTVITVPYEAVLNARENMLYYSIVGIVESVLKLSMALVIVYYAAGDKLVLYGILMAIIPLITMMIMRVYCHKRYEECLIAPRKYWDKPLMKQMASFAGWNFLTSFSGIVSQYGMGIVLNHFFGTLLNAAQGIANQISGQLMTFSHAILKALNPVITKNEGGGNRMMAIRASFAGCKLSFFLFSLFSVPFIVEAGYILKIWLGNIPDWAIIFSQLQLLRILLEQLTFSLNSTIYAQGSIKKYSQIRGVLNILPIFFTIIFFYFGFLPYVLYVFWIICWSILGGVVALYYAHVNLSMSYKGYLKVVLLPCVILCSVSFACNFLITAFMPEGITRLTVVLIISILLHLLFGWFIAVNKSEKEIIVRLFQKIFQKVDFKLLRS